MEEVLEKRSETIKKRSINKFVGKLVYLLFILVISFLGFILASKQIFALFNFMGSEATQGLIFLITISIFYLLSFMELLKK